MRRMWRVWSFRECWFWRVRRVYMVVCVSAWVVTGARFSIFGFGFTREFLFFDFFLSFCLFIISWDASMAADLLEWADLAQTKTNGWDGTRGGIKLLQRIFWPLALHTCIINTCKHTTHAHTHTYTNTTHAHTHTQTQHMHKHMHTHIYTHNTCTHTCIHTHIHTCTHTHIYTHRRTKSCTVPSAPKSWTTASTTASVTSIKRAMCVAVASTRECAKSKRTKGSRSLVHWSPIGMSGRVGN